MRTLTLILLIIAAACFDNHMTISWNPEGWIARRRRERADDRVAPPIPCDPTLDGVPPTDFDG